MKPNCPARAKLAMLALLLLSLIWGLQSCINKSIAYSLPPLLQLGIQTLIASCLLYLHLQRVQTSQTKINLEIGKISLCKSDLLLLNLRALVGALSISLILASYRYAPIANIVWIQALPTTVIWGMLIQKERISTAQIVLLALGFFGVFFMVNAETTTQLNYGEVLALIGTSLFSLSLILGNILSKKIGHLRTGTWNMFLVGIYSLLGSILFIEIDISLNLQATLLLLFQSVLVAFGTQLCTFGYANLPSSVASSVTTLDVIWAPLFAFFLFGQLPSLPALIGAILITSSALGMCIVQERGGT